MKKKITLTKNKIVNDKYIRLKYIKSIDFYIIYKLTEVKTYVETKKFTKKLI